MAFTIYRTNFLLWKHWSSMDPCRTQFPICRNICFTHSWLMYPPTQKSFHSSFRLFKGGSCQGAKPPMPNNIPPPNSWVFLGYILVIWSEFMTLNSIHNSETTLKWLLKLWGKMIVIEPGLVWLLKIVCVCMCVSPGIFSCLYRVV